MRGFPAVPIYFAKGLSLASLNSSKFGSGSRFIGSKFGSVLPSIEGEPNELPELHLCRTSGVAGVAYETVGVLRLLPWSVATNH